MFKKKKAKNENSMSYFIGGTAVGMAAGLLVGKVLSNIPILRTQNFVENSVNESANNYKKNVPEYKTENYEGNPKPTAMNSDLKNNINDLTVKKKYDKNVLISSYNNSNNRTLHNISIEDNRKYNLASEILEGSKEEKKCNIYEPLESNNIRKELSNSKENIDNKHLLGAVNIKNSNGENTLKEVNVYKGIELLETFDNDNTIYKNLPNVKSSMVHLNILPNYIGNASSMATCNDTLLQFEDEEENKIFNFTSFDEFNENDLISSTKEINSDDI
ncbi:uncharacterized protein LOC143265803 isoform X2 [Megachile rotundata]|uniref:uncharacterized protein LOC143265803 isoform X2 n=1 Tax=Megachile rotundata TaxID=143995 RepID=UPI003FD14460